MNKIFKLRGFVLLTLIAISTVASGQIISKQPGFGMGWDRTQSYITAGIPLDTFALSAGEKVYPHLAGKGDSIYRWSVSAQIWKLIGSATGVGGSNDNIDSVLKRGGMLTASRTLNANGNNLTFSNLGNFVLGGLTASAVDDSMLVVNPTTGRVRYKKNISQADFWNLKGNAGTTPGTNFLGTSDNQDLVLKTNSAEVLRAQVGGNVGIGTNNPAEKLHINGNVRIDGNSLTLVNNALQPRSKIQSGNPAGNPAAEGHIKFATGNDPVFELNAGENNSFSNVSEDGFDWHTVQVPSPVVMGLRNNQNSKTTFYITNADTLLSPPAYIWGASGDTLKKVAYPGTITAVNANVPLSATGTTTRTISADTTRATSTALVTQNQRRVDSLAAAGQVVNRWALTGNSGTNSASHFLGTTDDNDLILKRNSQIHARFQEVNTGLGERSLGYYGTGLVPFVASFNNAMGYASLGNLTKGQANTAIGNSAMGQDSTGSYNTALGTIALNGVFSGNYNLGLGYGAGSKKPTSPMSNQIFISSLLRTGGAYSLDTSWGMVYAQQSVANLDSARWKINGRLHINDGTQGVGKVFTDVAGDGIGHWVTPTGGGYTPPVLTANRAMITDGSGVVSTATTTSTELGYVNGVTSAIQTQLNAKQSTLTLTTTGTSGSATLVGSILNIPTYAAGTGTVTSVGLTVPSWLTVSGSPVTSSGTLAVSATSGLTANQFLATPNGTTGSVSLRSITAADIPTLNQNTTGNAATATLAATVTTNANLTGDVTSAGNSTAIAAGVIVNADINASAAIDGTKIVAASTSVTGALTSTDWNTFNNKFSLPSLTSGSAIFSNGTTLTQDNNNFFWDNTNKRLGIGTSSPQGGIHVKGSGYVNSFIETTTSAGANFIFQGPTEQYAVGVRPDLGAGRFGIVDNGAGGIQRLGINSSGYVKLGTGSASEVVDITGNLKLSGIVKQGTDTLATNAYARSLSGGGGSSPWTTSGTDIYNSNAGNVGIGTSTPAEKLHVVGNVQIDLLNAGGPGSLLINTDIGYAGFAKNSYNNSLGFIAENYVTGASAGVQTYGDGRAEALVHGGGATEIRSVADADSSITSYNSPGDDGVLKIYQKNDSSFIRAVQSPSTAGDRILTIDAAKINVIGGPLTSTQYRLSALNTAPSSATATGTTGEIRITATYIYICTATNTWVRAALSTW